MLRSDFLQIKSPIFAQGSSSLEVEAQALGIQKTLEKLFPENFFTELASASGEEEREKKLATFRKLLPFVSWEICDKTPGVLSVFLICKHVPGKIYTFMSQILRHSLVAGKKLDISHHQAVDFGLKDEEKESYVFCEVGLSIQFEKDLTKVRRNLPLAAAEIRQCVCDPHAARILLENFESFDHAKIEFTYDDLHFLRRRNFFDASLFELMYEVLATSLPAFRSMRSSRHLSRLVATLYYLKMVINKNNPIDSSHRHVFARLFPVKLRFPFGERHVTAVAVSVSALDQYEFCTTTHLMNAVAALLPNVRLVKNSNIEIPLHNKAGTLHYFEVEYLDGSPINPSDRKQLAQLLPSEIKGHIEELIHPVFMPRNDEEIYRNVVKLAQKLDDEQSPPQIIINYEHQIQDNLVFNAVCLRAIPLDAPPLTHTLASFPHRFFFDQVKIIGNLNEELVKEANIFRIHVLKSKFMRKDGSIDIHKTTLALLTDLRRSLPNLVDFHDDLMHKQLQELGNLKKSISALEKNNEPLLESLFYSMTPQSSERSFSLGALKGLFELLCEALTANMGHQIVEGVWSTIDNECSYIIVRGNGGCKEEIDIFLSALDIPFRDLGSAQVCAQDMTFFGYIRRCSSESHQKTFVEAAKQGYKSWHAKSHNNQTLNLAMTPSSAFMPDPQMGYDHESGMLMNLLFCGLMSMNSSDQVVYSLAEKVEISKDRKTYRFVLREAKWSNGKALIAYDFEYSWKRMINSNLNSVYGYLFFIIKNAKKASEKQVPIDDMGVWAEDEKHLVIELEEPSPYFLELTAQWPFFPVSSRSMATPAWSAPKEPHISCGPFKISHLKHNKELQLVKNPFYWGKENIKLERINLNTAENFQAELQMFDNNEIDWVSFVRVPFSPDMQKTYEKKGLLTTQEAASNFSYFFNTQCFPFNNTKMRRAFGLAINRSEIIKKALTGSESPATSISAPSLILNKKPFFKDGDLTEAAALFSQAMLDLGLTKKQLPKIVISHLKSPIRKNIALVVAKQWQAAFGIDVILEELEWDAYFQKITYEDFHVCGFTWYACYHDPADLLGCFKYKTNKVNCTHWEHPDYIRLLEAASKEYSVEARRKKLLKVEQLLINEMPVIPLYSNVNTYLKKDHLKGVTISTLGTVSFKNAYIQK